MNLPPGQQSDPSKTPLVINPSGAPPNFDNPPSLAGTTLGVGATLLFFCVIFVVIRLVTNYRVIGKLGIADYLCLFAFVLMTCYYAVNASSWKTARHAWDIPLSFITISYIKTRAVENAIIGPTLWSSKASMLALYLQLFGSKRWLRWVSYSTLIIAFPLYWVQTPLAAVYCMPRLGASWNIQLLRNCSKLALLFSIHGVAGLSIDLLILVLPLPIVYHMNLTLRKKIGLVAVFLTGLFAVTASAVSLYYRVRTYNGVDQTWSIPKINTTIFAEGFVTIIVSCAPATSSFWNNIFTKSVLYNKASNIPLVLRFSQKLRSKTGRERSLAYRQTQHGSRSTSHLNGNQRYYELSDIVYGRPATEIRASSNVSFDTEGVISKSTTIEQSLEHSRTSNTSAQSQD